MADTPRKSVFDVTPTERDCGWSECGYSGCRYPDSPSCQVKLRSEATPKAASHQEAEADGR